MTSTSARVCFLMRSSNAPAQPTHSRYSASGLSSSVGTFMPSAQSMRLSAPMPHGLPLRSRLVNVRARSVGTFSCTSTRFWRICRIFSGWSMNTGQTSWQAPHVVHAHSTSSVVRPPISGRAASASSERAEAPCWKRSIITSSGPRSHVEAQVVAQVVDHLHRRQRLARVVRGAEVGAARALGAREAVHQRLPGEVLPALDDAGRGHVVGLHVQLGQHAALAEVAEVDVGEGGDDVAVLRVEQVVPERQQHDDVRPPRHLGGGAAGEAHAEVRQHQHRDRAQDRGGVAAHRDQARLQHDAPEEREADDPQHQEAEHVDRPIDEAAPACRRQRRAA